MDAPRPARLVLRLPHVDEEQEFLRAHRATSPDVLTFLHYYEEGMPFGRYLEILQERAGGIDLPVGHVPSTLLFAFDGSRIVGRVSIRHWLNDFLLHEGGHIGYAVVPEFRRRGYATAMLRQAVDIARDTFGIERVLVTCDNDNIGSIRVIEKNGGVLENVVVGGDGVTRKRRYWIEARGAYSTEVMESLLDSKPVGPLQMMRNLTGMAAELVASERSRIEPRCESASDILFNRGQRPDRVR